MGKQHSKLFRQKYRSRVPWKSILRLDKFDINGKFPMDDEEEGMEVTPLWLAVR